MISSISNISRLYVGDGQEINDATLVWENGKILWVGSKEKLPSHYQGLQSQDAKGQILIPGLIDCHTHLAFAGWRADEFELKILGKSYLEIAQSGGGILSTMRKTRAASKNELISRSKHFLSEMLSLGITTIECKSGYGLTLADELKLLEVYQELNGSQPVELLSTLLAAHTIPPEFKEEPEEYVNLICNQIIPQVGKRKLAQFCDVFVEKGAFTEAQARRIIECGQKHGLQAKLHVDQLSDGSGAALAADLGAVSADHLEFSSEIGLKKMASKGVVAVLLPLASLYARQPSVDARKLVALGLKVSLATDFNPGTAPSVHLPFVMSLGCLLNRLTPSEALSAVTLNAAHALKMSDIIGTLEVGKQADFAVIEAESLAQWLYNVRANACLMTVKKGQTVYAA